MKDDKQNDWQGVALSEQLKAAYDKVSVYPEERGDAGLMDLLALRNLVPAAIDAISRASSSQGVALSVTGVMGVVELEVVIDEDGFPVWCAAVPNACQEHIKDAVEREIFGAEKWVVRSYIRHPGYLAPQPAAEPVELGEFRIHPCHDAAFGCQYDVVATSSQHAMLATMDGAKLYIVGDSIHATMQDAWQEGYRAGIEKGRKDQAVQEKHYLAGFNAARASSSRAEVEIPEGYALVPKEPTEAINRAIAQAVEEGWLDAMIWYKALLAAGAEVETCTWDTADEEGAWDSQCGECWLFIDGGPKENGVKFCQGCGKRVVLAAAEAPNGDQS